MNTRVRMLKCEFLLDVIFALYKIDDKQKSNGDPPLLHVVDLKQIMFSDVIQVRCADADF